MISRQKYKMNPTTLMNPELKMSTQEIKKRTYKKKTDVILIDGEQPEVKPKVKRTKKESQDITKQFLII